MLAKVNEIAQARGLQVFRIAEPDIPLVVTPHPAIAGHYTWQVDAPMPYDAINAAIQGTQGFWSEVGQGDE